MSTACDRRETWAATVFEAIAVLRAGLSDPATSRGAAAAIMQFECTRMRHAAGIAGTAGATDASDHRHDGTIEDDAPESDPGVCAELGLLPDGIPDPAVWGEEAETNPLELAQQIIAGRRSGTRQSRLRIPRHGEEGGGRGEDGDIRSPRRPI